MNEIVKVFNDHPVRIVERAGETWFVAKDVCSYFGDTNHKRSVGRLDDDEREIGQVTDALGRRQNITLVNEAGLYRLLFNFQPEKSAKDGGTHNAPHLRERLEKLRSFKRWVTHDVLPGIRKNGAYLSPAITDEQMKSLVSTLEQEIYRRIEAENRVEHLERQVEKLALRAIPKRRFGEISEKTGLPMDKIIPSHLRSDRRSHELQFGRYIQLLLPLYAARELLENNAYTLLEFAND